MAHENVGINGTKLQVKPRFQVDQRSIRDRFLKLERNFKRKMAQDERASGIDSPELDVAVQDIVDRTA